MRIFSALFLAVFLLPSPALAQAKIGDIMTNDNIMTEDRFWNLIDQTIGAGQEQQSATLQNALSKLTPAEIEAFERAFHREQKRAYTWDLWGAAYVMNGGASDDGFEYFQRWLISKGRKVFEAALADPDSLADVFARGEVYEFEEFAYAASYAWQEKTGINPWKDPKGTFPYTGAPPAGQPSGVPFKEDAAYLSKRYPKLWARSGIK